MIFNAKCDNFYYSSPISINLYILMITSLSDEVGNVRRRGQLKDFEVVYKKLDEFVDVRMC